MRSGDASAESSGSAAINADPGLDRPAPADEHARETRSGGRSSRRRLLRPVLRAQILHDILAERHQGGHRWRMLESGEYFGLMEQAAAKKIDRFYPCRVPSLTLLARRSSMRS